MPTYTVRQQQVLEFVRATLEERGIAPTLEEIATDLGGISRVSVLDHLRALERKGAIKRRQREARAIEILDPQYTPSRGVPLVGTIAAGTPILEASVREEVDLEEFLGVENSSFLLRVRGSSMIEDHICDGDLVLVESRTTARDGETVVAVVDEEVTLKRFRTDRDRVRLEPANASLAPMVFPADAVTIRGVVRGVIRRTQP
jgi:repressor LexA